MIAITPEQLKTANLIFVDHARLREEVNLLQQQVTNTELILENSLMIDSLRNEQLSQYKSQVMALSEQRDSLKKSLTRANWYTVGSLATTAILAIILLWTPR